MSLPLGERIQAFKQTYYNYLDTYPDTRLKRLKAFNKACGSFRTRKAAEFDTAQKLPLPPTRSDDATAPDKSLAHRKPYASTVMSSLINTSSLPDESHPESPLDASQEIPVPPTEVLSNSVAKYKRNLKSPKNHPIPSALAKRQRIKSPEDSSFPNKEALSQPEEKALSQPSQEIPVPPTEVLSNSAAKYKRNLKSPKNHPTPSALVRRQRIKSPEDSSFPNKEALSQPEEKALSQPEEKALSQPEEKALSQPEEKALSQPEEKALSQPEEKALSQPEEKALPDALQTIDGLLLFMQKGMAPEDYNALRKAYTHPKKGVLPQKHLMRCCMKIVEKKEKEIKQKHLSFLAQACKLLSQAELTTLYQSVPKTETRASKAVVEALKPFLNKQYFWQAAQRIKSTIRESEGVMRLEPSPRPYQRLLANPESIKIHDFSRFYKDHLKSQTIFSEDRYHQVQDLYRKIDRNQPEQCQQFASEVLRICSSYQQALLKSAAEIYHTVAKEGPREPRSMDAKGVLIVLTPNILQPPAEMPIADIYKNQHRDQQLLQTLMEYINDA